MLWKAATKRTWDDYRIRIQTKLSLLSKHNVIVANDLFPSLMWVVRFFGLGSTASIEINYSVPPLGGEFSNCTVDLQLPIAGDDVGKATSTSKLIAKLSLSIAYATLCESHNCSSSAAVFPLMLRLANGAKSKESRAKKLQRCFAFAFAPACCTFRPKQLLT